MIVPRDGVFKEVIKLKWGCCWWVAKLCPTLCDPMDYSMPISSVLHHFLEFTHTHIHWVGDTNHLIFSHPLLLQSFLVSGSFPMSCLFESGGQDIRVSASASVLPMNIQGWFPLGLTGLISLQSRGCQEFSPTPQFKSIKSLVLSLLYSPTLTFIHDYWKNNSFD